MQYLKKGIIGIATIFVTTTSAIAGPKSNQIQQKKPVAAAPKVQQVHYGEGSGPYRRLPQNAQEFLQGLLNQTVDFPDSNEAKNPNAHLAAHAERVCVKSFGGFVIVAANNKTLNDGDEVCARYGFQWAVVEESNVANLKKTFNACSSAYAAIKSFNGYEGETCQLTFIGEEFYADLAEQICDSISFLFVCQEIPVASETVTLYTTVETKSETATVTDVVHRKPESCPCWSSSLSSSSSSNCPCALKSNGDIHLLKNYTSWNEAQHACKSHGWRLLDVTLDNVEQLTDLARKWMVNGPVWIRSWMGFKGGECRAAMPNDWFVGKKSNSGVDPTPYWYSGMFLVENACEIRSLYVACQEDCRQPATATGPLEIGTSFTYSTTTVDTTITSLIKTVTTTVTLLDK